MDTVNYQKLGKDEQCVRWVWQARHIYIGYGRVIRKITKGDGIDVADFEGEVMLNGVGLIGWNTVREGIK